MEKQLVLIESSIDGSKVERKFTREWNNKGLVNEEKLPELIEHLVEEKRNMIDYIESLHDKLDYVLQHNKCCSNSNCLTAGCTSDHK